MFAPLLAASISALYGGGWRTQLCSGKVAAKLAGAQLAADPAVWVAVDREPAEGPKLTDRFEPRIVAGVPDAVARLRPQRALIDQLMLSIPRKSSGFTNPEWYEAAGYCVDRLMLAWLSHLDEAPHQVFEDLRVACGGVEKARFFERRGFALISEDDATPAAVTPDGLLTHRARLPSSIVAYEALCSSSTTTRVERQVYQEILTGLRCQPAPAVAQDSRRLP
tara:strand:- start:35 stop:700 length:666 start_codon:yes stop_codon:yes gene_type:complete